MSTVVLGINGAHDASACLLVDGELVVAVAEERLNRIKSFEGFPALAVAYCLETAGLAGYDDIDAIVVNQYVQQDFDTYLLAQGYRGELIVNPSHHLLHAYYAWVASGWDDAAVLILDGSGYTYGEYERRGRPMLGPPPPYSEMEEAESSYIVAGDRVELVGKRWSLWVASRPFYRFASLGHMYSMASQYIFGHFRHAGKTMGLAAFGDPSTLPEPFVTVTDDGLEIDTTWISRLPPRSDLPAEDDAVCRDLAAKVQQELEWSILWLAEQLHLATGRTRLAISGGVGLNSVTNGRLLRESSFKELFVTPAAGDAGVAIGAALLGHHQVAGVRPRWTYTDDYHGRAYSDDEIDSALADRTALVAVELAQGPSRAAIDLAEGRVVGWFELGSEFGPRALGHRSILCDPRPAGMRDHLNAHVKFREPFRPYAASVLAEDVADYFDLEVDDPFMLVVAKVREHARDLVSSVVHVDGTCRVQSVRRQHAGALRQVIEQFHELTGLPMVLNTSFNIRGEPIVETPAEAIECFLSSNLDVLYLQGRRVTKHVVESAPDPGRLVPHLTSGLTLRRQVPTNRGAAAAAEHHAVTRTGWMRPIEPGLFDLMALVDARRDLRAIAHETGLGEDTVVAAFTDLQHRGLVAFEDPGQAATHEPEQGDADQ